MGNILSTASNQQTVRIMTSQPTLTQARTIINTQQSQQQPHHQHQPHRIVSVSLSLYFVFFLLIVKIKYRTIMSMISLCSLLYKVIIKLWPGKISLHWIILFNFITLYLNERFFKLILYQ